MCRLRLVNRRQSMVNSKLLMVKLLNCYIVKWLIDSGELENKNNRTNF